MRLKHKETRFGAFSFITQVFILTRTQNANLRNFGASENNCCKENILDCIMLAR